MRENFRTVIVDIDTRNIFDVYGNKDTKLNPDQQEALLTLCQFEKLVNVTYEKDGPRLEILDINTPNKNYSVREILDAYYEVSHSTYVSKYIGISYLDCEFGA